MKRLMVVLLSLGLIMGFTVSAFAIGADFSGEWYFRGWYIDNPTLQDKGASSSSGAISTAHVDQRIRMLTRFKVADGLEAVLRLDAFEDFWSPKGTDAAGNSIDTQPGFAFDHAYVNFRTVLGAWKIGYTTAYKGFGTDFNNSAGARPGLSWFYNVGLFRVGASWQKESENGNFNTNYAFPQTDKDYDVYTVRGNFDNKKGLDAGGQIVFARDASRRVPGASGSSNYLTVAYAFEPYVKAKFGPVALEAEGFWTWGDAKQYDAGSTNVDSKADGKGIYVNAKYDMGPAYVGAWFQYMSGDDPTTADKMEGTLAKVFAGGTSQIADQMFFSGSSYYTKQVSPYRVPAQNIPGASSSAVWVTGAAGNNTFDNGFSYSVYGGYSVTPKLDVMANFYILRVDEVPDVRYVSKDLGKELRLAASYKIYDNLALSIDGVYLWTGDFFKGFSDANRVDNNYFIMTMLDLTY